MTRVLGVEGPGSALWRDAPEGSVALVPPCPLCGYPVTGYEWNQDVVPAANLEPAWPGGPLIAVPSMMPRLVPVPGSQRWTFDDCGHVVRQSEWSITVRPGVVP